MTHHSHHGHEATDEGADERGPSFGGHGMLIVGEDSIYLSHLPMFMLPPQFSGDPGSGFRRKRRPARTLPA